MSTFEWPGQLEHECSARSGRNPHTVDLGAVFWRRYVQIESSRDTVRSTRADHFDGSVCREYREAREEVAAQTFAGGVPEDALPRTVHRDDAPLGVDDRDRVVESTEHGVDIRTRRRSTR